jgi:hypothetical protein
MFRFPFNEHPLSTIYLSLSHPLDFFNGSPLLDFLEVSLIDSLVYQPLSRTIPHHSSGVTLGEPSPPTEMSAV